MTTRRIGALVLSLCLASPLVSCSHSIRAGQTQIKNLTDDDIAPWMLKKVGENVCIRAKIVGTYRRLSFHMDSALADEIGPYTGHVYTTITQRYAVEHDIDFGDKITVCGSLVFDGVQNPKGPPELLSYVIENSVIIDR